MSWMMNKEGTKVGREGGRKEEKQIGYRKVEYTRKLCGIKSSMGRSNGTMDIQTKVPGFVYRSVQVVAVLSPRRLL